MITTLQRVLPLHAFRFLSGGFSLRSLILATRLLSGVALAIGAARSWESWVQPLAIL